MKLAIFGTILVLMNTAHAELNTFAETNLNCNLKVAKFSSIFSEDTIDVGNLESEITISTETSPNHGNKKIKIDSTKDVFIKEKNLTEFLYNTIQYVDTYKTTQDDFRKCIRSTEGCQSRIYRGFLNYSMDNFSDTNILSKSYFLADVDNRLTSLDTSYSVSWEIGNRQSSSFTFQFDEGDIKNILKQAGERLPLFPKIQASHAFKVFVEDKHFDREIDENTEKKLLVFNSSGAVKNIILVNQTKYALELNCSAEKISLKTLDL